MSINKNSYFNGGYVTPKDWDDYAPYLKESYANFMYYHLSKIHGLFWLFFILIGSFVYYINKSKAKNYKDKHPEEFI